MSRGALYVVERDALDRFLHTHWVHRLAIRRNPWRGSVAACQLRHCSPWFPNAVPSSHHPGVPRSHKIPYQGEFDQVHSERVITFQGNDPTCDLGTALKISGS